MRYRCPVTSDREEHKCDSETKSTRGLNTSSNNPKCIFKRKKEKPHSHLRSNSLHLLPHNKDQYKASFTPYLPLSAFNVATTDLHDSPSAHQAKLSPTPVKTRQRMDFNSMDPQPPIPLTIEDFIQGINTALAPLTTAASAPAIPMAWPATFSGEAMDCRCALQWAESLWNVNSLVTQTLDAFTNHFKEVFSQAVSELSVQDCLFWLRQGGSLVWEYSVQFRSLAALSGWNETALLTAFRQGLNSCIRQQMPIYDNTVGLETFILKAFRISQHFTSPAPAPEPMQISDHQTCTDHDRKINSGLCLYCGASLRPCINYQTLNSQTVKYPYPSSLVPPALKELCGAHIFSKLDLQSPHNPI
ncbi:Retrotransposon-like protein 1 [Labeo rohita]|uniref:Retrotransposon-like protein 1 n=1 Tax=Labeo rohita TaxID=84645 RepID=A0ABQ8L1W5_LABRO|nr:Retrotransposon-like protein 1 [Labeo rohita]